MLDALLVHHNASVGERVVVIVIPAAVGRVLLVFHFTQVGVDVLAFINMAGLANHIGNNSNLLFLGSAIPSRANKVLLATRLGLTLRAQYLNILIGSRNSSGKVSK